MGCTHPYWSALQVGSQHLARQFARHGWKVHYFSAPISLLHLPELFSAEVIKRLQCAIQCQTIHANGMIRSYVPFSLIVPAGNCLLRHKVVIHNWFRTMVPPLKSIQHKSGFERISLLYIDNLSYHFLLDQFSYQKSIFRVMDMHERFPGWEGEARNLAQKIARQADVTVYSAQGLEKYVDTLGYSKSALVPNGVDFDFFNFQTSSAQKHPFFKNIPDPVLLYTGMIDSRLDFRLIRSAAYRLPHVSFVFAGPVGISHRLSDLPANIYLIGPVPHAQLPDLIRSAAAGLIPFDVDNQMDLIQGIRPLKLFEYLAAGIPVISAKWPELERMNSPAWLYENEQEFIEFVHKATDNKYDHMAAMNFAKQHDWKHSFELMLNALETGVYTSKSH
ncbi:MAG: glycosyltransferase family 1 protein [Desulfobacteraceae bacterium]|nr:glycosyltransferase family 1 protein [Desulfobacteraceae bacterium]MBC2719870.1 glycosyltransferase [Desulfobacteraceae bacterium]